MRLKNIFSITLFLLLGFIIQGCSDSDKADATRLTVVRNNAEINQLTFSVGSGSAIIGIQSDGGRLNPAIPHGVSLPFMRDMAMPTLSGTPIRRYR